MSKDIERLKKQKEDTEITDNFSNCRKKLPLEKRWGEQA